MFTSFFAGLLGILYFLISMETIKARRGQHISLGTGENNEILQIVSAHNNCASYVPILIILLYLAESSKFYPDWLIATMGTLLTLGRCLHYWSFRKDMNFKFRIAGMLLTLFPLMSLSIMNIYSRYVS